MNSILVIKRMGAGVFDIFVSIVPILVVAPRLSALHIEFSIIFFVNFFIVACIIPLVAKGKTIGDSVLRIRLTSLEGKEITVSKIFFRNLVYVGFLALVLSEQSDKLFLISSLVSFLAGYFTLLSNKNRYCENLTALDFLFKTKFMMSNKLTPEL